MSKWLRDWMTALLIRGGRPRWPGVALMLSAVVAPVVIMGAVSYAQIDRNLTALALSRRQGLVFLAASTLRSNLDRLRDIGVSLATRVRFRELVARGRWTEAVGILEGIPQTFPFVDRLFLTDRDGTLLADTPELPGVRGKNFSFRDWYQGVSREWEPFVSEVYKRTAEPRSNVFAVAVPIGGDGGRILGILVLQIRLNMLLEWAREIEIGPRGLLYLVDRKGHLAAHPDHAPESEIVDYSAEWPVRKALQGERGIQQSPRSGEGLHVYAYEPVPGYGWGVVAQQPAASAFAARDATLRNVLWAYGLIILFSASLTYTILRALIDRKMAEEQIARLNADLNRRAGELEASNNELGAFSYSVSHDLRAPLRHVGGFVELLHRHYDASLDQTARRYLDRIGKAAVQMGRLIDDLLAFSRMGRAEMRDARVDLARLVRDVVREVEENAPGRRIVWTIGDLPEVAADPPMLRMVLSNLLSNAVKYTGPRSEARIEIDARVAGDETIVRVRDNGVGFDMQYASKLFGVFQRLHKEFEGTGIGLANVRRIIHRHGGRAWAEGEPDRGATFYFTLPLRKDVAA
jgi:signal transduction histidine kinase